MKIERNTTNKKKLYAILRLLKSFVINKEIVNTPVRRDFIYNTLIPTIEQFEKDTNLDVRVSGMPYIRTVNSQNIIDEIQFFVLGALLVTAIIFFFFFRSFRATFITLLVVMIGVVWAFGFIGLFGLLHSISQIVIHCLHLHI